MSDGLLTEEEVKSYLKIDSPEINQLIHRGKLTAYRVGGSFVRYRKEEVIALRSRRKYRLPDQFERSWFDKTRDFLSFHSVYVLLSVLIVLLVVYFLQA
ncbi:MAG: helix-turn-helix domain-containing protein [Candidatus Omnitrophica bacterium]|nr:helix-turn-helix domain-containing protein [Candidatus Omnitrophota bacterium]